MKSLQREETLPNKLRKLSHPETKVTIVREIDPLYELKKPGIFDYLESNSYNKELGELANCPSYMEEVWQYLLGED